MFCRWGVCCTTKETGQSLLVLDLQRLASLNIFYHNISAGPCTRSHSYRQRFPRPKIQSSLCYVLLKTTSTSVGRACEIRKFHVAVVQRQQRNVHLSAMYVQSCCFANLNLLLFGCSSFA